MKYASYFFALLTGIFALVSWNLYKDNQELEKVVYANYTNQLSSTSEKMDHLRNSVHQSLLYEDPVALNEELSNITRLSSEIKQSINQMPLAEDVRVEWTHYLTRLGSAAEIAKRNGDSDWHQVMSKASVNMDELVEAWHDVSYALFKMDGKIAKWDTLRSDEQKLAMQNHVKTLNTYREADFPLTASESDEEKKKELQMIMDKEVSKDEAVQKVLTAFPDLKNATMTISRNRDDAKYNFYHIQFVKGARIGYADVTVKGGHILSFLLERPVSNSKVQSHETVKNAATSFLKSLGIDNVELTDSRENSQAWHFVFTRKEGNYLIYPDSIQIKVAKDTADVIGMNAMEYIQKEKMPEHEIKPINLDTFFKDSVVVQDVKTIVTDNDASELRYNYETIVYREDAPHRLYRIVIDAESHVVQKIEVLH